MFVNFFISTLFRYFWLDPKVTKKSRLRALRTTSRRSRVGKSGNSLRSDSLIFFRPTRCSVGSPPEAHGRTPEAFEARFLTAFGMTKAGVQNDKHSYSR